MRHVLAALFAFAGALPGPIGPASAQSYPVKPIRIVVPYPPGDTGDTISRLITQKLTERLSQQVIVDNRSGASGQIGLEIAARAAPDGYTLAIGQVGNLALATHTYRSVPYDPLKDFTPVALVALNYLALVVKPSAPYKTVGEMIAWAKANPGKVSFGSNGEGGLPHMSFELLRTLAGFTYVHVPYKGSAQIVNDLMAGQIDAAMASYTSMGPIAKAGKVRLLAVTNPTRMTTAPEIPLVSETVPGYTSRGWFGFVAPTGTPRAIVSKLNEEINRALKQPDVAEKMTTLGLILSPDTPEAFGALLKAEHATFAKLTRAIGFKPQ